MAEPAQEEPRGEEAARRAGFRWLSVAAGGALLGGAFLAGGTSDAFLGCENITLVAAGSPEGAVYTQHGTPDRVVPIGEQVGPSLLHWQKYLAIYEIDERHTLLGGLRETRRRSQIAYLIQDGKVLNGGYVGTGGREAFVHPDDPPAPLAPAEQVAVPALGR